MTWSHSETTEKKEEGRAIEGLNEKEKKGTKSQTPFCPKQIFVGKVKSGVPGHVKKSILLLESVG